MLIRPNFLINVILNAEREIAWIGAGDYAYTHRIGAARTLATTGTTGLLTVTSARAIAIASAAGCIRAQWKGADTRNNFV